jgi:hypothetical protein
MIFWACFDFPIQRAALVVFSSKALAALCVVLLGTGWLYKRSGMFSALLVLQI